MAVKSTYWQILVLILKRLLQKTMELILPPLQFLYYTRLDTSIAAVPGKTSSHSISMCLLATRANAKTNYCDLVMLSASVICEVHTKHYSIMIAMNDSLKTGIFSEACQNVSLKCRQQRDNFQFWPYMFMNLIFKAPRYLGRS